MMLSFAGAVTMAMLLFGGAVVAVLALDDARERSGQLSADEDAHDDVARVLLAMALVSPLVIGGAALGGRLLARQALAPMREASRRAVAAQEFLDLDLPTTGRGDEWDELATAINALRVGTRSAFDRVRRFTADAAHELRTPLTTILGEADLALRRERSTTELRGAIEVIRAESSRMAALVESLLTLARADGRVLISTPLPVDLSTLLQEAARRVQRSAALAGKPLQLTVRADAVEVQGDAQLLARAVENLLENALLHGGPHVHAELIAGTHAVLRVADDGPGVAEALAPLLFERFVRGDASRSSGGTGLGLAVVRSIVTAHGGQIRHVPQAPGALFEITLPRAPA
jgi:signal transduction histidine kinase